MKNDQQTSGSDDVCVCVCVIYIYINPSSLLRIKLTKLFNFCMSQFPQL